MNSLLKRQLKKYGADKNAMLSPDDWRGFVEDIDRAFTESEENQYFLQRSLMISSKEMQDVFEQLRESEARYAFAAQGANDGLWDWDLVTDETYYSPRWIEILGIELKFDEKITKKYWLDRIHFDDRANVEDELEAHISGHSDRFKNEHRVLHHDGSYKWVLIRGLAIRDENGKAHRIAGSLTDITERRFAQEQLEHDAVHDALTGLPNRKLLLAQIEKSQRKLKGDKDYSFAVLFIDVDRFKVINDSMGHQVGDEVLIKLAEILGSLIRSKDVLARLGGDEFVILFDDIDDKQKLTKIADRLLIALQRPLRISGKQIYSSVSIGIAYGSEEYNDPEDIIRDADLAMYRAKINGKGRYEIFRPGMRSGIVSSLEIEMDLRRGYEQKEFFLHYQPIVSLENGSVIGLEALVRWKHFSQGLIPPNDFIPLAEKTGLILPIGKWILKEACGQMREWQEKYPLSDPLTISVNLSAIQLEQPNLTEEIAEILRETRLDPTLLRLEITETVIMHKAEQAVITVNELRDIGVNVSIDDFGTGYSSLGYLHRFPVDMLKIDRTFIGMVGNQGENTEIVQAIINLASNLDMDVVAEGIETAEQLDFLRKMNCKYGQGFYYSRPLDAYFVADMLRDMVRKEYSFKGNLPILDTQYNETLQ